MMSGVAFPPRPAAALRIALLLAASLAGLAAAGPVTLRDAAGRAVAIADSRRIVAIGGSVTEILHALGEDAHIVAVDSTSQFPPDLLRRKPNVGYMRQLSPEGVLALAPTLILAAEGSGPKEAVAVIEQAGIPFVHVPDRFDGRGIVEKIRLIATAVSREERGRCLAKRVDDDLVALAPMRARIRDKVRVLFVLSLVNGRAMIGGRNTAADGIIALAGAVNAAADVEGYKIVSDEAIVAARPAAIVAMERPGFRLTAGEVFGHPAFAATPAARTSALVSMEGLYLLGFGPRTARAARDLAASLYPALATAPLPSERDPPAPACGS